MKVRYRTVNSAAQRTTFASISKYIKMARRISKPLPGAFLVSIYLAMLFSPFHSFADALAIEPGIAGNVTMQKRDDDYACFDPTPNVLANE